MSTMVYKLVDGSEVIAGSGLSELREVIGDYSKVTLTKPRVLQVSQDPRTGQIAAGLMPWLLSDPDASVDINHSHIMTCVPAPSDLERNYLQQTSGLDLTSKL